VPIYDFAKANEELAKDDTDGYYPCCGKNICRGCVHSFCQSGNGDKCPFCNSDRSNKTDEEKVAEVMRRVEANDAASICLLGNFYQHGLRGLQQDHAKAMELLTKSIDLEYSKAHSKLAGIYHEGGDMKKAKFHYEAAAMAGHEMARSNLGFVEASGNIERAIKHWTIGASAGSYIAMHHLRLCFELGRVTQESIDSTLAAYNSSCAEFRSKARDDYIQSKIETI
jgi:TPR repeat protein